MHWADAKMIFNYDYHLLPLLVPFKFVLTKPLSKNWAGALPQKLYPKNDIFGLFSGGVLLVRMAARVQQTYFGYCGGLQFNKQ